MKFASGKALHALRRRYSGKSVNALLAGLPAGQIFEAPREAYTQALMKAAFDLEAVEGGVVSM